MEEEKLLILRFAVPIFALSFTFFSIFVGNRLPQDSIFGWKIFSIGGYIVISGLGLATYFFLIKPGAALIILGTLVGASGLTKMFWR